MPTWSLLINARDALGRSRRHDWLFLDCRHDLKNPAAGPKAFMSGHLPGAVHAHVDRDLSGPLGPTTGRHPLPTPEAAIETFSRWGIGPGTQVVAYDDQGGVWAARAWWLLRHYGHEAVAVLDGGLAAWRREGGALHTGPTVRTPARFQGRPGHMPTVEAAEVLRGLGTASHRLLDARAPERFRGEAEPIDPVRGHIPSATNLPAATSLDADGRFRSPAALAKAFRDVEAGERRPTVAYCGSGVTACHIVLARAVAGLGPAALYPGSWSEWIRNPGRPVEVGPGNPPRESR